MIYLQLPQGFVVCVLILLFSFFMGGGDSLPVIEVQEAIKKLKNQKAQDIIDDIPS